MPAPLSIVIPTLNAGGDLPKTSEHLLEGATSGLVCEVVISDGGSSDDTLTIAKELGAVIVKGAPGRGGQIGRGVGSAKGEWLLILHADTHLSKRWSAEVLAFIASAQDRAGYFKLRFRSNAIAAKLVATGANLRSRLLGLPYGDQGLLIHRDLLSRVGGIPDLPLMEDVALARRLRGKLIPLNSQAETSAERYTRDGWARRAGRNLWTLMRYLSGTSPEKLIAGYERQDQSSEN